MEALNVTADQAVHTTTQGCQLQPRPLPTDAVPWLRRLVAGLSSQRSGFDPRQINVRHVVDKVTL
jgi:hypothetical protein